MAGSTNKKVVVHRFEREFLAGFVSPQSYLQPQGIELLKTDGSIAYLSYSEVQSVCFVKDFEALSRTADPKVFNTRPKMEGLWVRMTFRNGEIADGILPNNLLQLEPYGFTIIPPEPYSNNQRIFVPRLALTSIHVLGVVGSPLTRIRKKAASSKDQIELFE